MVWSKESRQARGYGAAWDQIRLVILTRDHGICQPCLKEGRVHVGTHVDHIVSKAKAARMGWTQQQIDAESNLQCINKDCHEAKTKAEQGHKDKASARPGPDGWPVGR